MPSRLPDLLYSVHSSLLGSFVFWWSIGCNNFFLMFDFASCVLSLTKGLSIFFKKKKKKKGSQIHFSFYFMYYSTLIFISFLLLTLGFIPFCSFLRCKIRLRALVSWSQHWMQWTFGISLKFWYVVFPLVSRPFLSFLIWPIGCSGACYLISLYLQIF